MRNYLKKCILLLFILLPVAQAAGVPSWQIIPNESSLTFVATQNNAPVTGKFTSFNGQIHFDPNQLTESNIKIIVDIASISDAYNELADNLKTADWFNTKMFPQAIFQSNKITKIAYKTYEVRGMLTIRDKTLPLTFDFTQEEYSETKAVMEGSANIKRTAYGVGQGEWADTKNVRENVTVNFKITATKKS